MKPTLGRFSTAPTGAEVQCFLTVMRATLHVFKLLNLELSHAAVTTLVGIFEEMRPVVRTTVFG